MSGFFERKNLYVNQMVLIKENDLPSCKWLSGHIVEIYSGPSKKVCVVKVKKSI